MSKWIWDAAAGLGLALVCIGAGLIYFPLAPLVGGIAFLAIGFLGARPK